MFEKFNFSAKQISQYYRNALRDFAIASQTDIPEVAFRFGYDCLLKLAITACAVQGLRVKAKLGHHWELLEKLAFYFNDPEIKLIGNDMRTKRNFDLYGGGNLISQKEVAAYIDWLKKIIKKAEKYIRDK